jgi:hypothetical protein
VHFSVSGAQNAIALLFLLRWDWYGFDKKHTRSRYTELAFLHPVGSAGHVVHSGASGESNVIALFFMLGWDRYGFDKKKRWDTLRQTFIFASCRIYGICRVVRWVRGTKC